MIEAPVLPTVPTLADWHAAVAAIRALGRAPTDSEQLPLAGAVGRVLAEPAAGLAAGTLLRWRHLPLLVAAGLRTLAVRPRLRAGIVAVREADDDAAAAIAPMIAAAFEQMGGRALLAGAAEPPERLDLALQMFAGRCELVFVIGAADRLSWFRRGALLVVVLPPRLRCALAAFVTQAVPLIRRLQGRGDVLPETRVVDAAGFDVPGVTLMHERSGDDGPALVPCGLTPACLARAAGLAWQPAELEGRLSYLPFEAWLH